MNISQALALRGELDSYERQENMWLLAHILNCSALELKLMSNDELTETQQQAYFTAIERLNTGEPLAYILGSQPFWSLDLKVTHDTLVPRPDTEILVETALNLVLPTSANILDLGTGTGAIALSLAKERSMWQVIATDIYPATLEIAQENAQTHQLSNVQFALGAWYQAIDDTRKFDLIVSNPPYIDIDDSHLTNLPYEPRRALVAEQQGLADLVVIISQASHYLNQNGWLIVEHGYNQGQAVRELFLQAKFNDVKTICDYGGNERITLGCYR